MPLTTIYLDHAATTPLDERVKKAMQPYFDEKYGNPSSIHAAGIRAHQALESARATVANILHCTPSEIVFTSGGTESINLALQGIARANKHRGNHIITTNIEHPAVLRTCDYLQKNEGFEITYLEVDKNGMIDLHQLKQSIRNNTILISIQYANNEIGTIQPVAEIGRIAREHTVYFHTDACQAGTLLDLDVNKLFVDLLTLNGSKLGAPQGTGMLYLRKNVCITPLVFGGGQENRFRSGTENLAGIVGFSTALQIADAEKQKELARLTQLSNTFVAKIRQSLPDAIFNGHPTQRLANNISITIPGIDAESLVLLLNDHHIYTSTGSACSTHNLEPSHVLTAIGHSPLLAHSTIRITLGKNTTEEHLNKLLSLLPSLVQQLKNTRPAVPEEVTEP